MEWLSKETDIGQLLDAVKILVLLGGVVMAIALWQKKDKKSPKETI